MIFEQLRIEKNFPNLKFPFWIPDLVKTCPYLIVPSLHRHYSALVQVKKLLYAHMLSLTIKVLNPQDISNMFHFTSEIWLIMLKNAPPTYIHIYIHFLSSWDL
jgi:hypothetical protein